MQGTRTESLYNRINPVLFSQSPSGRAQSRALPVLRPAPRLTRHLICLACRRLSALILSSPCKRFEPVGHVYVRDGGIDFQPLAVIRYAGKTASPVHVFTPVRNFCYPVFCPCFIRRPSFSQPPQLPEWTSLAGSDHPLILSRPRMTCCKENLKFVDKSVNLICTQDSLPS